MTAGSPAADSVAGQQTHTFHIPTAATAVDISQLAIYLQSHYKEVEAVTSRRRGLIVRFADHPPSGEPIPGVVSAMAI